MNVHVKAGFELVSLGAIAGTLAGYLPYIAAFYSILWYTYLFYKEYKGKK